MNEQEGTPVDNPELGFENMKPSNENNYSASRTEHEQTLSTAEKVVVDPSEAEPPHSASTKSSAEMQTDSLSASTKSADGIQEEEKSGSSILIEFVDFGFAPIEGLQYKLVANGRDIRGMTNATCNKASITDLPSWSEVEIWVFREHTRDFKNIGSVYAYPGQASFTIVSPKLKFEVPTEVHAGDPGDAEENLPPIPAKVPEKEETTKALSPATASPDKPSQASQVTAPGKPQTAEKQPPRRAISPGRDTKGNPQATVQDSGVDWLKRKILAVFNFWSWRDFQAPTAKPSTDLSPKEKAKDRSSTATTQNRKSSSTTTTANAPPAQGHPKINPLASRTAASPSGSLSDTELEKLRALITFVENQALLDYSSYRGAGGTTVNILKEYARTRAPTFPSKDASKPLGLCQAYVKVALFKAGYTNGPGWEQQAKFSGRDWLKYGFTEVSNALPQVEITYEAVTAPEDQKKLADHTRKTSDLKKLIGARKKQNNPMSAEEITAAEKAIPAMPAKQRVKYVQPDLMYTLPGDVIVYEQVDPAESDPAGHVDIRTYHGFMSDFVWHTFPSLGGPAKQSKRYRVSGVYRKVSDTMAIVRIRAFLRILREHEAKGFKDPYHALRYDPSAKPPHVTFPDHNSHPYAAGNQNKPAGAYQIKLETWKMVTRNTIGWPDHFSPDMQDRIAMFLLQQRPYGTTQHPRRSALGYIMEGQIEDAINKTGLWNEWSCLPGGGRESQIDIDRLKTLFSQYVREYAQ